MKEKVEFSGEEYDQETSVFLKINHRKFYFGTKENSCIIISAQVLTSDISFCYKKVTIFGTSFDLKRDKKNKV